MPGQSTECVRLRTFSVVMTSVCVCSNIHHTKLVVMYILTFSFRTNRTKYIKGRDHL